MDREAWRAVIHGVTKSWTRLSNWTELNWKQQYSNKKQKEIKNINNNNNNKKESKMKEEPSARKHFHADSLFKFHILCEYFKEKESYIILRELEKKKEKKSYMLIVN